MHESRKAVNSMAYGCFLSVIAISFLCLLPFAPQYATLLTAGMAALALAACRANRPMAALCVGFTFYSATYIAHVHWPWPPLLGLGVSLLCLRACGIVHDWHRFGRPRLSHVPLLLVCAALTWAVLLGWFFTVHPNVTHLRARLPHSARGLVVAALLFSCVNAYGEEGFYRGVMLRGLQQVTGSHRLAMAGQALVFATVHWRAFPDGWFGVCAAGVFAMMMALLRRRSGGLWAPWSVHVLADLLIVSLLRR